VVDDGARTGRRASSSVIMPGRFWVFTEVMKGACVIDYPWLKLRLNRMSHVQSFIHLLFGLNDTTNAFNAYRRTVIEGCHPLLSAHFDLTVEIPLKAVIRGYSWTVLPITWRNRGTGAAKLKIQEIGSRHLFICLYIWLEKHLSRGSSPKDAPALWESLSRRAGRI
jgi:dolichol-phosphate mannosyltransferase